MDKMWSKYGPRMVQKLSKYGLDNMCGSLETCQGEIPLARLSGTLERLSGDRKQFRTQARTLTKKVIFFDNIDGEDLYNVILNSKKIVAFHGMMTNIGSINRQQVLDLFHCKIKSWNDYRNCRNSFYEFKPKYAGYDFIIPSNDINKTIRKMRYSLKK